MGTILLIVIVILRVLAACILKIFGKNYAKTRTAHFFLEAVSFAVGAILFLCVGGFPTLESDTVFHGIILGSMAIIEEVCFLAALGCGSMALTMIIATASMILPIILAKPLWGDVLSIYQIIGTALMLVAMGIIMNVKDVILKEGKTEKDDPQFKKWLLLVIVVFLSNGAMAIDQKYQSLSVHSSNMMGYLVVAFTLASVLAWIVYFYLRFAKKEPTEITFNWKTVTGLILNGVVVALLYLVVTAAMGQMPVALVMVINNGVSLIIITLIDVIFFKQKLKLSQYIGILIGIIAVVVLSLG